MSEWFTKSIIPAFNPRNLDYARYYQQVAINAIKKYRGMIASGTRTKEQVQNLVNDIAIQQDRLKCVEKWMKDNGVKPYPIQPPLGPEGF